jgi:2-amino-4-hydroxy-6-hydroxymethyldihydropteridine diphosphokinase
MKCSSRPSRATRRRAGGGAAAGSARKGRPSRAEPVASGAPVTAYVGLGANLGDPRATLRSALESLSRLSDTRLVRSSSMYRSAPVGYADQPEFVNAVVELETRLDARALLRELLAIEADAGRTRSFPNAPRTLDLDLLLYGEQIIDAPELNVPHPRMHERRFVLAPLAEIAPGAMVPGRGRVAELARHVSGQDVSIDGGS